MVTRRAALLLLTAVAVLVALPAAPASAHPLGNFTANSSALLVVGPDSVRVGYVLDLAEIPAFQARQDIDADADGQVADREAADWAAAECGRIAAAQRLGVNGRTLPLTIAGTPGLTFPAGQAGLVTLRLECPLAAATGALPAEAGVTYADEAGLDRIGWREVVAVGDGVTLVASDVPDRSPTDRLREYPEERLAAPLRVTTATLSVDPSGGPAAPPEVADLPAPPSGEGLSARFTALVARADLTAGFAAVALLVAAVLGALHAVAPGHGKTVMAAYLVGQEGGVRQALQLGATVAVTHTLGVFALGVVVQTSTTLAPERLYPWLGVASGLLFSAVGAGLLVRALRRRREADGHGHGHDHHHHHDADHHHHGGGGASGWRVLVLPGLAGGMLPSPSALVVLLGGIALGRTWFGIVLVVAYGAGMAATLVAAGLALHRLRDRLVAWSDSGRWARLAPALPVITSALIVLGGAGVAVRSLLLA